MLYTDMTKKALKLSFEAHKEQLDKSGMPYVFHPFHLAEQMPDEDCTVVALLHDVIEDTEYGVEDLQALGFSDTVLTALMLMTHEDDTPYLDYVAVLNANPIARTVKLSDLKHNSDLSRLSVVTDKDLQRVEKYKKAIHLLEE